MKRSLPMLYILSQILMACGGDVSKKPSEGVVEMSDAPTTSNTSIEGRVIGHSSGRYSGSDVAACTSGSGGQQEWIKSMYLIPSTDRSDKWESGNFYLYAIRRYRGNSTTLVDSATVPVQSDATFNIGLNVMNNGASQVISSSHVLGGWRTWGPLVASVVGASGIRTYSYRVSSATYVDKTPPSVLNDSAMSLKTQLINTLNYYLDSTKNASFYVEYFSDASMNQVMILTGITAIGDYRYEFEFGREAQPLKPMRCSGYHYPVLSKSTHPLCKSAILGCSLD